MTVERRAQRVEKELQQIVAKFLIHGLNERLPGLVSVSRVQVGEKIRTAKIYVSVLGNPEDAELAMEILTDRISDVQKHVGKSLRMKFVPRISFVLDKGFEHMLKVESLLHEISKDKSNVGSADKTRSNVGSADKTRQSREEE